MSGAASRGEGTAPALLALLTAVAWAAVVVAAFGILTLVTGLDVIPQSDAGPLLGPVMVLAAGVVLGLLIVRILRTPQGALLSFVAASAGVFLTLLIVGGILYTIERGELAWLLIFPLREAVSPFIIAAALLAGGAALAARAIGAAERSGRGGPHWPWERADDE